MNSGYFKKVLKGHGWQEKRMDGGGYLFTMHGPLTVTLVPLIRALPMRDGRPMYSVTIYGGVSTPNFNWFCDQVEGRTRPTYHHDLVDFEIFEQVAVDEWSERLALKYADRIISKAKSLDLEAQVSNFCDKPDHLGWGFTVNKFVCLRLRGKDEVLNRYLEAFKSGKPPNLNPNVTIEMIQRALEIDVSEGIVPN